MSEGSPKNKTKRCPKGERRNPKTGICEKIKSPKKTKGVLTEKIKSPREPFVEGDIVDPVTNKVDSPKNKTKRCSKGETRNKKTGICLKLKSPLKRSLKQQKKIFHPKIKDLSKMSNKETAIFEKRKSCIQNFREKLPKVNMEKVIF